MARCVLRLGWLVLAFLVASCGGGGGGGGSPATFTLSTGSVSFSATQGGTPPASQNVIVTVTGGSVFIGTTQTGSGFSHFLQITGPTTGQITITPSQPTTPGTFTGTIIVRGCPDQFCQGGNVSGSPKTISVTYTVAAAPTLGATPASVNFESNTGATPASQDVTLSLSSGTQGWSATINYLTGTFGWLTVTPTFGTLTAPTGQTLTFSVNSAPASAEARTASVVITAGSLTKTIPVTYVINEASVKFVSPYVLTTGTNANVILRGHGFSTLNPATRTAQFGALSPTTATFVSDTEIRVAAPTVAGNYPITVGDGTTVLPSRPGLRLLVVNPTVFPADTLARPATSSGVGNLIYDAERRSLYVMDGDNNRIEAYRFNTGTSAWTPTSAVLGVFGAVNPRIALSPDGTELVKSSGGTTLTRVDPATLGVLGTESGASILGTGTSMNLIAFANDGRAIGSSSPINTGVTLYRYDMLSRQFAALSTQTDMTNRSIVASGDGSLLVLPTFEPLAPGFEKALFFYSASTGTLTQHFVRTSGTGHVSVSRDGSRIILVSFPNSAIQVTTVYDSSFTKLGNLPDGLAGFVISPDGSTAYAYFPSSASSGFIRKFNLTAPNGTGGFAEVGAGVAVSSPGPFFSAMAITPDGGTVFLAGRQAVIVQPAP